MAQRPTPPSTPRLSELAHRLAVPSGITTTAWPSVCTKCRELGLEFDPWQVGAGQVILAKREDGKYATTIGGTGLSIPRQVGKTFLVGGIVFALCLLNPGMTVIWTAHRLRTAGETFEKMQGLARRRKIKPFVRKVVLGSGEEEIRFTNGSRILFGARERGFGRGFDEVDVLIFDEAQILTDNALDDMVPATNQSRQPAGALLLFMGTPPKPTDQGEVFRRMRTSALSGEDEDTAWIEFSADPAFKPTDPPAPMTAADWRQIAKANPSYPKRTPRESILRMRKQLTPESNVREGFGIWDEDGGLVLPSWTRCPVAEAPAQPVALGLAVDLDRVWLSLAASSAGPPHFLAGVRRWRLDLERAEAIAEVARIQSQTGAILLLDKGAPAGSLTDDLTDAGVQVTPASMDDFLTATGDLYDAVEAKEVAHLTADLELDLAVINAGWRKVGKRKAFAPEKGDITMLEAAVLARWGAKQSVDPWEVWT